MTCERARVIFSFSLADVDYVCTCSLGASFLLHSQHVCLEPVYLSATDKRLHTDVECIFWAEVKQYEQQISPS